MSKYFVFTNLLESHIFDEQLKLIESGDEKSLVKKYSPENLSSEKIKAAMHYFKRSEYFSDFREKNINITKQAIRDNVKADLLIVQTINALDDANVVINTLIKRLREWYELYSPEISRSIQDHEKFLELIVKKSRKELLHDIKVKNSEAMGGELDQEDIDAIMDLAKHIEKLFHLKKELEKYLDKTMKKACPNTMAITGSLVGAKLLAHAGSLKKLAGMPSSTVQLLGAEKALFRHRKTGAKPPKHGIIIQHQFFSKIRSKDYGKLARMLADKISIAAKIDYFKGKYIGDKLMQQLEEKLRGVLL